ncbi:MAG: hypothetical protein ACREE2_14755 [Stellaceae bacterium]
MSQTYMLDLGDVGKSNHDGPGERLSQRAAILAIAVLSLLLWSPILLPFAALLHR